MDLLSLFPDFFRNADRDAARKSNTREGVIHLPCPAGHTRGGQKNLYCWLTGKGYLGFRCFAGCPKEAVLAALGVGWEAAFPVRGGHSKRRNPRVERTHEYKDAQGRVVYRKCIGRDARGEKFGWWQRWDAGAGAWANGLQGMRCVPYRLPELVKSAPRMALIVEGEKDADALTALGFTTTTGGGANCWLSEWSSLYLGLRPAAVIPDNDAPGLKAAQAVCGSLLLAGCPSVRLHRWPEGTPDGWDVADELALLRKGGAGEEQLRAYVREMVMNMRHWRAA